MRLTIERLRTLVLVAGGLLLVALAVFLTLSHVRSSFNKSDLPKKLAAEIQQEANGWTYTHSVRGHMLYKIHASRLIQLKQGGHVLLHDVKIEIYGTEGNRVDRIEGNEFDYDPGGGIAKAAGPVEITLMRPGEAPAMAPKVTPGKAIGPHGKNDSLTAAAQVAEQGEIHVKTSGLTFDRNTGIATTDQAVEFSLAQGGGSAVGASYGAEQGNLILNHEVHLHTERGKEPVHLDAAHAEFDRDSLICRLAEAAAHYRTGMARAQQASLLFRSDGSVVRLDAEGGVTLATQAGGHLQAPRGALEFDERNQPRRGHLEGGVVLDENKPGRQTHGTAPLMDLEFTAEGQLREALMMQGVSLESTGQSGGLTTRRTWTSPVAEMQFRSGPTGTLELAQMHGSGGVVMTGESRRAGGPPMPQRVAADDVRTSFGAHAAVTAMVGLGHADLQQTTATGARQQTSGDRIEVHFSPDGKPAHSLNQGQGGADTAQIESATVDGHVVLVQTPAAKPGAPPAAPLRATGGRAVYQGAGQWLHLTQSPHVDNGGLQLAADSIDVAQSTGDAYAHGDVKATWFTEGRAHTADSTFGGNGPSHVVAAEAQLHQTPGSSAGEVVFRGKVRLWQQANSITAPVVVLDRARQTLTARTASQAEPVQVSLLSTSSGQRKGADTPQLIRLRGGDLKYSAAERKGVLAAGILPSVVAQTAEAQSISKKLEFFLLPPGNHAGKDGTPAQIDRIVALGGVVVSSQGRRGTGEQLVYDGDTGDYTLTGTAASPPRMTDPARGMVTGDVLIFSSRDDSVSIEGAGRKTRTETTAPR